MFLSIDGADKTGKTTQIQLIKTLNPDTFIIPSSMSFSDKWFEPFGQGYYTNPIDWWVNDKRTERYLIEAFIDSIEKREQFKTNFKDNLVVIEDRSNLLLLCSLLAWLSIKSPNFSDDDVKNIEILFESKGFIPKSIKNSILLVNGNTLPARVNNTMKRIDTSDEYFYKIYEKYQEKFQEFINRYYHKHIIIDASEDINYVHNNIINTIRALTNDKIILL